MMTSYLLTRTIVPTLVHYLLPVEMDLYQEDKEKQEKASASAGIIWRCHEKFEHLFERLRDSYHGLLVWALDHRLVVGAAFVLFSLASFALTAVVGQDFFPYVDSGQMRLHVRTPSGTRIEEAEDSFRRRGKRDSRYVPEQELDSMLDNIGLRRRESILRSAIVQPLEMVTARYSSRSKKIITQTQSYIRLLRERPHDEVSG